MRAKQSFTASGMYSCNGSLTELPVDALLPCIPAGAISDGRPRISGNLVRRPTMGAVAPCPADFEGEGLLHDARNLMGALGLYCDLLSMPGVLKPEHLHYTEEVRLLSTRSTAMIQRLMDHRLPGLNTPAAAPGSGRPLKMADAACSGSTENKVAPVSLRSIVERSSGLLRRVACGRTIEICYGAAAAVPVRVADESVERILVNLVRNAAAALTERDPAGSPAVGLGETGLGEAGSDLSCVSEFDEESCVGANQPPGAIRIGVGCLMNRVGDAKPWPFRRVRLTVEDAGCGIAPEQLERLVSGGRAPSRGSHGIGFRVVRELVAGSGGDLRVMSTPAIGTRVQIEWPMAAAASEDPMDRAHGLAADAERRKSC